MPLLEGDRVLEAVNAKELLEYGNARAVPAQKPTSFSTDRGSDFSHVHVSMFFEGIPCAARYSFPFCGGL